MKTIAKKIIRNSLIIAAFASLTSCHKQPGACFNYPLEKIVTGQEIVFRNCSQNGVAYRWAFGDSTISNELSPTHTYSDPGDYIVTLTVYSKGDMKKDEVSKTIKVEKGLYYKLSGYWNWYAKETENYWNGNLVSSNYQQINNGSIDFISESSAVLDSGLAETVTWSVISDSYNDNRVQIGTNSWYVYFEDSFGVASDSAFVLKDKSSIPFNYNGSAEYWYCKR